MAEIFKFIFAAATWQELFVCLSYKFCKQHWYLFNFGNPKECCKMVSSCLMLGCTSSTSTKGLSFHRFPKDPKLKSLWVAATRRHKWEPTKWSRICGAHFSPNNYKNNKLLAGTVPKRGIEVTCFLVLSLFVFVFGFPLIDAL